MAILPTTLVVIGKMMKRWRSYRARADTRRLIANLPVSILKDIGWPGDLPSGHRRGPHGRGRS